MVPSVVRLWVLRAAFAFFGAVRCFRPEAPHSLRHLYHWVLRGPLVYLQPILRELYQPVLLALC